MATHSPSFRPPPQVSRIVSWAIVGFAALVVLIIMQPHLLVTPSTPAGGDMGAHVMAPAYLRDSLLPSGRITGWSNSWFAGFPIFYFYFPLPSLMIVFLDVFLPYGVAFKIVTVLGLIGTVPATYFLARSFRFPRAVAPIAAAASVMFLFMESFTILGGNVASTLAGEFSFSWSFALSMAYLGAVVRAIDDRKWVKWAAILLALTALTHLVTTIIVVAASLWLLFFKRGSRRIGLAWSWGFGLAAFWALPLLARVSLTADMAWFPLQGWQEIFPTEIWPLVPIALVGSFIALRRDPRSFVLLFLTIAPTIAYFYLPQGKIWNGRFLPFWFFGLHLFAAVAVGTGISAVVRNLPERVSSWWARALLIPAGVGLMVWLTGVPWDERWWRIGLVLAGLLLLSVWLPRTMPAAAVGQLAGASLFLVAAIAGISFITGWANWNYSGYENKPDWPEYEALMQEIDTLPAGRIQWEANSDMNKYGTPMALMLFPYWSEGHNSQEGLYFESSLTTPFHFINASELSLSPSNPIPGLNYHNFDFDRGVEHMQLYNVRYYVSFTPEAAEEARAHPDFTEVLESAPFVVFELPQSSLVDIASNEPVVYEEPFEIPVVGAFGSTSVGEPSFGELALEWYDDLALMDRLVVADGPKEWARVEGLDELAQAPESEYRSSGEVSNVVLEDHRIAFDTTAVGVPHLVKVSYFPNWHAEGAEGPYRATPSLMVVVPTQEHVELEFGRTWAETFGWLLTLASIVALVVVARRVRATDDQARDSRQKATRS